MAKKKKRMTKKQKAINKREKFKTTKKFAKQQAKKAYKKALSGWVIAVKTHDNWTCQICKKYLKDLTPQSCHAHHILDKKNFKCFSTDINNGITLCPYCHKYGPRAVHLNVLFFANWLMKNRPEIWKYLNYKMAIWLLKKK